MSLADDLRTERVQDDIHRDQQLSDHAERNGTGAFRAPAKRPLMFAGLAPEGERETDIENTGFVLLEFEQASAHVRQLPPAEVAQQVARISNPFIDRLERRGHAMRDAVDLLSKTLGIDR